MNNPTSDLLRHHIATLVYRLDKVVQAAPPDFGVFSAGSGVRTPAEILSHMSDVLLWGLGRITGEPRPPHAPETWSKEVDRFTAVVAALNRALAAWNNPDTESAERLLQGPFADAMTHTGQLAMLCRMAGQAIPAENFYEAPIRAN